MRITVLSSQVFKCPPPGYSGLEMIAYQCARGLAQLGHKVTLFAPDGSVCPGCDVGHTGPAGWDEHAAFNGYWKHLNNFHAVIDHTWQKRAYGLKAEGWLKAPVLGVFHAPIDTMIKTPPPGVEKPCFVCISDDQRSHLEGVLNRKARTCYNGVDLDFYRPVEGVRRGDTPLFLARFSTIKGPDIAVAACKEAGVPLDLVGDTSITNEPDFLRAVKSLCDDRRVIVGSETRGGTVLRYSRASFMIHPNQRFREPFGLAPVEAMACGLPVLAWDNGAMRETVAHGETGYLVDSYERLVAGVKALAEPGAITDEVRARCRERASKFSVQNMAKRYAELVEEAVHGGW